MNKINTQYQKIKSENRLGLMTHVVVGYPSLEDTRNLVKIMATEGVDFIELQIPFSDPVGDGPTIRKASTDALENNIKVSDAFKLVKALREEDRIKTPLLFMTYMNVAFTYGLEKFCQDAERVGVSGLLIPDYNLEFEGIDHLDEIAKKYNQILIRFASMDSTPSRLEFLADGADGFIYCFSTRGITGVRDTLDTHLSTYVENVRGYFGQPLAVGFGISNGEQVKTLRRNTDIIIVGSAIIRIFEQEGYEGVRRKLKELTHALI